jgi:site-specific recombinase XerD
MSWARNYVTLKSGERIRYSFVERADSKIYFVRFRSMDGRRLERSTNATKMVDAIEEAHRLIREEYQQIAPAAERMPWERAKQKLEEGLKSDGKRPKTIKGYLETLDKLIATYPLAKGPADISERIAADFKTKYANGTVAANAKGDAKKRLPSVRSLDSRIRTLKAVFAWFKALRLVEESPFEKVTAPELDRHEVKYVRESDIADFFKWMNERFPGWEMPRLFFTVKAMTACRLEDICFIRSDQLEDGRLIFTADTTKNRSERYAVLPDDLYQKLDTYKGDTYLWERYPPELIAVNKAKGYPTHRQNPEFSPRRLYQWVVQIMQDYQKQTGNDFSSHDFRRAAFTRAAEEDIHPKRAAVAFDVTAETMLRYYTATEKKRTADEILTGLADRLRPKVSSEEE